MAHETLDRLLGDMQIDGNSDEFSHLPLNGVELLISSDYLETKDHKKILGLHTLIHDHEAIIYTSGAKIWKINTVYAHHEEPGEQVIEIPIPEGNYKLHVQYGKSE